MAERNIDSGFGSDPKIQKLSPYARSLLAWLIFAGPSHALGIYRLSYAVIGDEWAFSRSVFERAMYELARANLAHYDCERQVVWVVNMAKRQARSWRVWRGIVGHLGSLHETPLITAFCDHYGGVSFTVKGKSWPPSVRRRIAGAPNP